MEAIDQRFEFVDFGVPDPLFHLIDNIVVNGTDGITIPPIPGFPTAAIVLGILTALGLTLHRRRRTKT